MSILRTQLSIYGTFGLALVGVVALAHGADARPLSPTPTAYASGRTDEGEARELRRILELSNGQKIRVVSRKNGDRWEYKSRDEWKSVDAALVVRATNEADVLKEWHQRSAACDRREMHQSIELARFAFDRGLVAEGLAVADACLAIDPDHPQVRKLLDRSDLMSVPSLRVPPTDLDAAKGALYRFGASMPPAARELAVRELAGVGHDDALRAELARELSSNISARRSFAALALRRIFPGSEVKPMIVHAVTDPSADVRRSASLALRAVDEPGVIVPIVRVLSASQSAPLRANAAEALGIMRYAAAVEPLMLRLIAAGSASGDQRLAHSTIFVGRQIAYVQDFDVEIAQASAIADPNINTLQEGMSLEAAVQGVQEVSVTVEVATIRTALGRITGAAVGNSSKDWIRWWNENADQWRSSVRSDPAHRTGVSTGPG